MAECTFPPFLEFFILKLLVGAAHFVPFPVSPHHLSIAVHGFVTIVFVEGMNLVIVNCSIYWGGPWTSGGSEIGG